MKMHPDEIDTRVELVQALVQEQFPQWVDLPITPVLFMGTDNALYRLGDDKVVRLPRIYWAVGQVDKEQIWLPHIAPHLPVPIPIPLAKGVPGAGYPWHWSVYSWLSGENVTPSRLTNPHQFAIELATFVQALQQIETTHELPPGQHNSFRGVALGQRDPAVRVAIASLQGVIDTDRATKIWDSVLQVSTSDTPLTWIHGDLQPGNLLMRGGSLSAVIDFGCMAVGDPACDLMVAWNLFTPETRSTFRSALAVDAGTWLRGCGWALSVALIALPYYQNSNPTLATMSRYTLNQIFADFPDELLRA
jgi:aminoglycoside phosphotransferase (APT) family kinase protein